MKFRRQEKSGGNDNYNGVLSPGDHYKVFAYRDLGNFFVIFLGNFFFDIMNFREE